MEKFFIMYNNLVNEGQTPEYIRLAVFKLFNKDLTKLLHYAEYHRLFRMTETRLDQETFRQAIIFRDRRCIISGFDPAECEAAHIVPYAKDKSFDPSNGILLNRCLHKLFDDYQFSINPESIKIVIKDVSKNLSIKPYLNKKVKLAPECIPFIKKHYKKFMRLID